MAGMPEFSFSRGRTAQIQRQEQLADYVLRNGSTSVKELSSVFNVSIMTIHRDLDELERQAVLRKTRGVAEPQPTSLFEGNVRYRIRTAKAEKEALSKFALTQIEPGQSVILDDSTTTLPLVDLLQDIAPLTVITNFAISISRLSGVKGVNLISLGGEYLPSHDAFVGVVCERAIDSLRADIFFMSTAAVSEYKALHQEEEMVRIKRAMMAAADRKVLLVDHNKLGKTALHLLAPLEQFDLMVVDSGVDRATLDELRECPVPIEVAPMEYQPTD